MPDVHVVTVQIDGGDDTSPGRVSEGFYTIEGSLLTMTYNDGSAVEHEGNLFQRKLADGENPKVVARALTRQIKKILNGEMVEGFSRPLNYSAAGVA